MNRTLHEITEDILALDDLLAECEGDVGSEEAADWIAQWMVENEQSLETKLDNYCALITEYEARADARKAEADRMAAKAKTDRDKAKWLRDRMLEHLHLLNTPKVECPRFTVAIQKNGGLQPVEITGDVPPEYRVVETRPDKAAIRTRLLEGAELPFAHLLPRGESLRIR